MNPSKTFQKLVGKIMTHILFWICVLLFFSFFFRVEGISFGSVLRFSAFLLPVTIATTYGFSYHLIPKYLLPKKYFRFALFTGYALIISAVFIVISSFYGLIISLNLNWTDSFPTSKSLFYIMITVYLVVVIASAFSLLKYNYLASAKNEELKNRILEAQLKLKEQELEYLKIQIHPHFLFNTLNTIYGLSLSKNEKTPEMILQLSDLLDYILYQTRKPLVQLKDEVNHIKNYINLEKKRFQDALTIEFNCDEIPSNIEVAPMLLLPFIENSFKHGKNAGGILKISIRLNLNNEFLEFEVSNSKDPEDITSEYKGIGLENIQRRLDILYGSSSELTIENKKDSFKVFLKLNTVKTPNDVV
ncbi:MAG: sensor histidine kinase [Aequorivita sp.]